MSALETRIKELVAFARTRDGEDRTLLFRNLIDLFIAGRDTIKNPSRRQLVDVIEALIPHVDADMRRSVAETLSVFPNPPMDLIAALAKDRASLVSPLLRKAPFDEDQLVELVGATGREHHHEISTRSDLTANVWIALARAAPEAPIKRPNAADLWRVDITEAPEPMRAAMSVRAASANTSSAPSRSPQTQASAEMTSSAARQTRSNTADPIHGSGDEDSANSANAGLQTNQTESLSPKVTLLHPKRKENRTLARLRILRTDEDLISERMAQEAIDIPMMEGTRLAASGHAGIQTVPTRPSAPRAPMLAAEDIGTEESSAAPNRPTLSDMVSRDTNSATKAEMHSRTKSVIEKTESTASLESTASSAENAQDATLTAPTAQAEASAPASAQATAPAPAELTPEAADVAQPTVHRAPSVSSFQDAQRLKSPISDPGQGGWAWRSDRDGFVTAVSPQAGEILRKTSSHLVGEAMLDLLGLNTKLGHPIARALQRRSAIHDAPVYLSHFDKDRRYWTLDAHPLFNARSGAFEGYEGTLMPVNAYAQPRMDASDHDEDDLFLPESRSHTQRPDPFGEPSSQTTPIEQGEQTKYAKQAAPQHGARQNAPTQTALPVDGLMDDLHSMVSEQTTDLVRKIMGGAFASLNGDSAAPTETAAHSDTDPLTLSWRALQDELRNQLPSDAASHTPQHAATQDPGQKPYFSAQTSFSAAHGTEQPSSVRHSSDQHNPKWHSPEPHGHTPPPHPAASASFAPNKSIPDLQASYSTPHTSLHANASLNDHLTFGVSNSYAAVSTDTPADQPTGIDMSRLSNLTGQHPVAANTSAQQAQNTASSHRLEAHTATQASASQQAQAHMQPPTCPPTPTNATLQALEASIAQLITESRSSGNVSLRLQAEMAAACLKVLKEQVQQ